MTWAIGVILCAAAGALGGYVGKGWGILAVVLGEIGIGLLLFGGLTHD